MMRMVLASDGARLGAARQQLPNVNWHRLAGLTAMVLLLAGAQAAYFPMAMPSDPSSAAKDAGVASSLRDALTIDREASVAGYLGYPSHNRSDVHMVRPDGTDLTMKNLRWDAEPFTFPIYAGVRYVRWQGAFGGMIDFLHDKAVTRVGKGAHGRRVQGERAIPDIIEVEGTLKGAPAPSPVKITEIVERVEFTHGHNMLLPTAMLRLGSLAPRLRPYIGIGVGAALPHVEVWPTGATEEQKTNEYQAAGPAAQFVFGLEWQGSYGPVFIEYKYTWAQITAALTGGKTPAWCNCDFVSDTIRHIGNWWNGRKAQYGELSTTLITHQIAGGAGYRLNGGAVPSAQ